MFNFFKKAKEVVAEMPKPQPKWSALAHAIEATQSNPELIKFYPAPQLPNGVVPADFDVMAMDGFCTASEYQGLDTQFYSSFLGFQALSHLAQSTEYRIVAETFAQEMTREWGEVKGEDVKKVELLEKEIKRLNIRNLFRKHIENDFLFGGSQISINIKGQENKTDLPLLIDERGIKQGSLDGFTIVEPMWTAPSVYNSIDALAADFFKPSVWWVLGKQVHHSRLMTLVMRPLPDMMKPAYNFYGVSMTQLMLPSVQRYQLISDSVAEVIKKFTLTGLKTDMSNILQGIGGVNETLNRVKTLALMRDNNGMLAVDQNSEEIFQINTPLTGLDVILDKYTLALAYAAQIPILKILGTPTAGLGNTSDGEIRVFYDNISAKQEAFLLPQVTKILQILQLNLFGEIDEDIEFKFNPLYQLDDNELADVNLKKATTAQILIQEGVIDNNEARQALSDDEDSGYTLDGDAPERDPYEDVGNEQDN